VALLLGAAVLVGAAGCTGAVDDGRQAADTAKLRVVATIFPLYDFTRAVAGGMADVTMLLAPGSSVHSFDPSIGDIRTLQSADVFFYIGGDGDVWVSGLLASGDITAVSVRLMDSVQTVQEQALPGEPAETGADEHIWTSPANAIVMVNTIRDTLCAQDSAHADAYRANAAAYTASLQTLDNELHAVADTAARRTIVVADRFPFRYLVDELGLSYAAAYGGCSDQTDASVSVIERLINTVRDEDIHYVFYAELSNRDTARAVCEQTGVSALLLHSCETVSKADFDAGVTYLSIMERNKENLALALNG